MFQRLKELSRNLAIYGLGDVATSIVSFLLLPVYVRFLSPTDYGVIGLLLAVEVAAKILFRWGVDASFMRLYYDCPDEAARQRLASTIFFFLLGANGTLLLAALAAAPTLAVHLFGAPTHVSSLRLVLVNTFIVGFYFLPFHVFRIEGRSPRFIALTVSRSTLTILMRLLLVVVFGMGVLGVVLADLVVTAIFTLVLVRWFAPLIRPAFSPALLRQALAFGLPRLPHGLAHQTVAVADRYLLTMFVGLREIGLYSIGASFGLALKLFLSAFEYAWAPFYFATMKEPDARVTFSRVTTYGVSMLVLLTAGLSAIAGDLVRLMTTPEFHGAARVVPFIALGVMFQGVYLLTSIGLNITKRTEYYPLATGAAAAVSVGANLLLIPRFGALGSAWANALAYGTLAAVSMVFSQRVYPVQYEWGRLARVAIAGCIALGAAWLPNVTFVPVAGLLVRGAIVVAVFSLMLAATGFVRPEERRRLHQLAAPFWARAPVAKPVDSAELAGEIVAAPPIAPSELDAEIAAPRRESLR